MPLAAKLSSYPKIVLSQYRSRKAWSVASLEDRHMHGHSQSTVKQCMSQHRTIAVAGMPESTHLPYKMNGEAAAT